ncbi:MAG TPA: hypothetical protein VFN82_06235, partial [Solirubrobacterales bacterium]|nr:hypothetical protein [Solirubrobacterales bacterium]
KSVLDRIDQRPTQLEQVATGPPSEDQPGQRSATGRPTVGKLAAELIEGDRFATLELGKACLERRESIRIREDLRGLLQRLVLVYRDKSRGGRPVAGDQHVVPPLADVIEQAAEVAAELSNWNGLCHWMKRT